MSKTTSGMILVAGPIVACVGGGISSYANTVQSDTQYAVINGAGIAVILAGLVMFFFGAMRFSRGT